MDQQPLASIIIPVYNAEKYIKKCMDSLIGQTCGNIEILAVDDGSADRSGAILDEYAAKDKRVKVFHQENKGQSAARNRALDCASGKWIAFADSDDICEPDMIKSMMRRALRKEADICWGEYILHHMQYKTTGRVNMPEGTFEGENIMKMFYTEPSAPSMIWAALYRREIFTDLRFPEGKIYEDTWLLPRLLGSAKRVTFLNRPVYHYFRRSDGTCGSSPVSRQMDLLWAKKETADYTAENYPDLKEFAYEKILECCCDLLHRIDRAGRKKYPEYWKRTVSEFENTAVKIKNSAYFHKGIILTFRLSPVILAKLSGIYPFFRYHTTDILRRINHK